uniref:PPPDE domain-containing protein n=1 Tax=Chromera velia CCMP2878 TaxID=1169474 RepID=A0A0G4I4U2_9ALVE|eukprot:Cvel_11011.t1-p1 / transcript=Cvel_11011.t1 / gene=Cvel_11011 / organism=Chromera_velia_CCMP2878 / gene_product=hypothetical protein / transcript_product=hypothetical protein / location=Cvel_scaffold678:71483-72928(+) / protein_length=482 / sequence_SO=supercontig / SO=protein_coding / is_pseudo=false
MAPQFREKGLVHVEVVVGEWNFAYLKHQGIFSRKSVPVPVSVSATSDSEEEKPKKKVIELGATSKTEKEVLQILDAMQKEGWDEWSYLLMEKNCQHFAEEFVDRLRSSEPMNILPFPVEIRALADTGVSVFGKQKQNKRPKNFEEIRSAPANLPSSLFWREQEEQTKKWFARQRQKREEADRWEARNAEVQAFTRRYKRSHPNARDADVANAFIEMKRQEPQQQQQQQLDSRGRARQTETERERERDHRGGRVAVSVSIPSPAQEIGGDLMSVRSPSVSSRILPQGQSRDSFRQPSGIAKSSLRPTVSRQESDTPRPSFERHPEGRVLIPHMSVSRPQPAYRLSSMSGNSFENPISAPLYAHTAQRETPTKGGAQRVSQQKHETQIHSLSVGGHISNEVCDNSGEVDLEGGVRGPLPPPHPHAGALSSPSTSATSGWGLTTAWEGICGFFGLGKGPAVMDGNEREKGGEGERVQRVNWIESV